VSPTVSAVRWFAPTIMAGHRALAVGTRRAFNKRDRPEILGEATN